ncbi:hypothetical protein B4U79_05321, partial [Dinothrombium tinctorium]
MRKTIFTFFFVSIFVLPFSSACRCYVCFWSSFGCQDLNCYGNVDLCSSKQFSPTNVQSVSCPGACENVLVTDPNGLVIMARRGCDNNGQSPYQDYYYSGETRCRTEYQFGTRIDKC